MMEDEANKQHRHLSDSGRYQFRTFFPYAVWGDSVVIGIPQMEGTTFFLSVFRARAGNEDFSEGAEVPGLWDLQCCLQWTEGLCGTQRKTVSSKCPLTNLKQKGNALRILCQS